MTAIEKTTFPLGLGTAKLRSLNGGLSARSAQKLLSDAFDQGIRFFDTAPVYGQGQAESAIGRLPKHLRDEVIICSKVGYSYGRKALVINALKPLLQPAARSLSILRTLAQKSRDGFQKQGTISVDIQPDIIRSSLAGTLRRLRRDRLDVLLLHDASLESLRDENCRLLDSLQHDGTIGRWGVSTGDVAVARKAVELENLAFLQVPVTPEWVDGAGDLFQRCHQRGVAVIANHVLSSLRPASASAIQQKIDAGNIIQQRFEFAMQQPAIAMVLCGTVNSAHLASNVQSMRRVLQTTCSSK